MPIYVSEVILSFSCTSTAVQLKRKLERAFPLVPLCVSWSHVCVVDRHTPVMFVETAALPAVVVMSFQRLWCLRALAGAGAPRLRCSRSPRWTADRWTPPSGIYVPNSGVRTGCGMHYPVRRSGGGMYYPLRCTECGMYYNLLIT